MVEGPAAIKPRGGSGLFLKKRQKVRVSGAKGMGSRTARGSFERRAEARSWRPTGHAGSVGFILTPWCFQQESGVIMGSFKQFPWLLCERGL